MRGLVVAAGLLFLGATGEHVIAQTYPVRPVRLVVPWAPGGSVDLLGRLVAQKLTEQGGMSVFVENRAGAGTNLGAEYVARSAANGYTLLMASSTQAINVSLYPKLSYDLVKDFVAISPVANNPSVLVVHPSLPVKTVKELVALAKARPGELIYASSGSGSTSHLAGELLKMSAGIDLVHVPFKGAGPALTDLLGGHVQMLITITAQTLPHIKSGKLRALAVTSERRLSGMPDLPTMQEAGIKGYEVSVWSGILAPAGMRREVVAFLSSETGKTVKELSERLTDLGAEPLYSTPEQFSKFIREEITKWAVVVKHSGARVDY
jgi:tripartite-type tricarboxylate transporter receptor subunit TctC